MDEKFSQQVKNVINGDEYYTLEKSVRMILPYIEKFRGKKVWCPFDTAESNFVKILREEGWDVIHSHIDTGENFFDYDEPLGDIIVSNPPFSKRDKIFEKLYEWDIPFALIMNFNGLFDSKKRVNRFRDHTVEMLIPRGRMKFIHKDKGLLNNPNFQSIYVCSHVLNDQITFDDTEF
jgi:hypothetical protein